MSKLFRRLLSAVAISGILAGYEPARADLSIDATYGDAGQTLLQFDTTSQAFRDAVLAPDGSLILAGTVRLEDASHFAAVRIDENGTLDDGFGDNGWATIVPRMGNKPRGEARANSVALQPSDGKVVLAGNWRDEGTVEHVLVVRLTTTGDPDAEFGTNGLAVVNLPDLERPFVRTVEVLETGRILVAGRLNASVPSESSDGFVLALDANGDPDPSFGSGGLFLLDSVADGTGMEFINLCPFDDGSILAVGGAGAAVATKLLSNGELDPDYADLGVLVLTEGEDKLEGGGCARQPGGRVLFGVAKDTALGAKYAIFGLTDDGQIDTGFADEGQAYLEGDTIPVSEIAVREDGDFVAGMYGVRPVHVSRDGSLIGVADESNLNAARWVGVLADGKVVGAGQAPNGESDRPFTAFRFDVTELECGACGELSGDCRFTAADALLALKMAVGQLDSDLVGDMDGNDSISAGDALAILRVAVGLRLPFKPCPSA